MLRMFEKAIESHIITCLLKITCNILCLLKTVLFIHKCIYEAMPPGVVMVSRKVMG